MVDYKNSAPSEIYEAMDNIVDKESFYENELSDAKLDQILKIVQDIHTRLESSSNITINRVQNNYSPKIKRSTSSVDTRKVLPAPSNKEPVAPNPIENRYSLPPRLPPSLPPRPPGALPQGKFVCCENTKTYLSIINKCCHLKKKAQTILTYC